MPLPSTHRARCLLAPAICVSYPSPLVRPTTLFAGAALTAALVLVAVPPVAGSRTPSGAPAIDAAAFQAVLVDATRAGAPEGVDPLDPAFRSAGFLAEAGVFGEAGGTAKLPSRPRIDQPEPAIGIAIKPPRYTLTGYATFYNNGTTAMRLPSGTIIRVCGEGGCVERVVNDYGPSNTKGRIIDLYRGDFFRICSCPSWSGTTLVTVSVY